MGVLSVFVLMACVTANANSVDSLLACAQRDTSKSLDYRIGLLRKALRVDGDRADVCAALGALFIQKNTPASRLRADRYIYRAIVLDPENIEYHLSYATLQRKKGFRYNAMRYFEKVLRMDSTQVDAACEVGDYYLQDMLKYVDARRFDGGGSMRSFAMESVQTAANYYHYALAHDPYCRRAYYGLGMLSIEGGYKEDLIVIAQALLDRWPQDRDGLLFLGLGYYAAEKYEAAGKAFDRAYAQMDSVGQAAMTSIELLGGGDEAPALFWQMRDPLFLTPVNERKLAHRGRVAYANLRFGLPDEGIAGWETDMGKVWIRYGRYVNRVRTLIPHREIWTYEDFSMNFFSYDSVHWKLELMKDERWALAPGGWGRSQILSPNFYLPERYVDPYRDQKYGLPVQVGFFKAEEGQVKVAFSWGIPKRELQYLKLYETYQVDLDAGIFVHRSDGEEITGIRWQPEVFRDVWTDSLKERYLLGQRDLILAPGQQDADSLALSLEIKDVEKKTVGVFRDTVFVQAFPDDVISMSSVLLASHAGDGKEGIEVIPNPLRTFGADELLYIYFEIYNLVRDEFGQTDFSVTYRVGPPDLRRFSDKRDRKAIEQLGISDDRWRISVSTDYRGREMQEPVYLSVDLSELGPGVHLLSIVVTDRQTGLQAWRETLFRIL
ncbi:MAG: GWxTD domain-containing protein [Gemmatimonadetes bacterium]|nr:GWxTD domain-containing protein [Gemmatimonadota bacterium]